MIFPQYRKLKNNKAFYKIINLNLFEEITFIGSKSKFFNVKAEQYPEKLRIQDMLNCTGFELSDEKEWLEFKP